MEQGTIRLLKALFSLLAHQTIFRMAAFQIEVQKLLDKNAEYAKSFPGVPTIEQMRPMWKQGTGMLVCMCDFDIASF